MFISGINPIGVWLYRQVPQEKCGVCAKVPQEWWLLLDIKTFHRYSLWFEKNALHLQRLTQSQLYSCHNGVKNHRAESPVGFKVGRHIYIKGVTDALVLTC